MKLQSASQCEFHDQGTFAPWFIGSGATTKRDAGKSRAPGATTKAGTARNEAGAVQRGRGWIAAGSTALSLFR